MAELGENEMLSWEFSDTDNLPNKLGGENPSDLVSSGHIPVGTELASASVLPPSPSPSLSLPPPPSPIEKKKRDGGEQKRKGIVIVEPPEKEKTLEGGSGEQAREANDDQDTHIWTERERRKKMKNMFTALHALLPQLSPKADKSTIVDEAVNYIQSLQQTFQKFQRQKFERLHGMGPLNYDSIQQQQQQQQQQKLITEETRETFMADYVSNNPSDLNFVLPNNSPFPPAFWTWTSPNVVLNVCGGQAQYSVCALKKPGLLSGIYFFLMKHRLEVLYCSILADQARCMYTIHAQMIKGSTPDDQIPDGFPVEQIYKQVAMEINFWVTS